ncbi:hypothetical protein HBI78_054500 [Parastagonospora nodorum]|nr:hypothetical protein HBI78_054500 [Parastagonospora nodorum]
MRSIFINNDLLRHEQQQRLPILRRFSKTNDSTLLDSICDAMTLISDKYEILYAEVKREIRERAILCYPLQSTAPNSRLRIITHLAMRSKRRKMRCNYNPKTELRNNDGYAEAVVYSAEQSNTFIRTLEREVRFEDKRSSIYYYTKTADNTVATKLYRATFIIKLLI